MATKTKDLREATKITDRVKPLEADENDPSSYCMFEVNGIQYQVSKGVLSIFEQDEE